MYNSELDQILSIDEKRIGSLMSKNATIKMNKMMYFLLFNINTIYKTALKNANIFKIAALSPALLRL
jgi:hypothetical protein